jgi:hypothetical protein
LIVATQKYFFAGSAIAGRNNCEKAFIILEIDRYPDAN